MSQYELHYDKAVMQRLGRDERAWQLIEDRYLALAALAAWCINTGRLWFVAVAVVA